MIGRVIEIASDGRHLAKEHGFLVVFAAGVEQARVPLDDLSALIANAHGLTYSNNLLVALSERGTPLVVCSPNHRPASILWPVESHHRQAARFDAQLDATRPMRKRTWQSLVRCKISMQAAVLEHYGRPNAGLLRLANRVRSGDPSNVEGQAARQYWKSLFGKGFHRDPNSVGVNSMLNYAYAIVRSMIARHVIAAGLHPGIPLHHKNAGNSMRLVDDLMEPFRPLADAWVRDLFDHGVETVDTPTKQVLASLPTRTLKTARGFSPVTVVAQQLCTSLATSFESRRVELELPSADTASIATMWDSREAASEIEAGSISD
jgi:CRISPR-associated protein Cas1